MNSILEYITLYAPVIIAILAEVGVVAGLIAKVQSFFVKADKAVAEIKESQEYTELKNQMTNVIKENIELKKKLNIVIEKLTHMKVEDGTISNDEEI